MAVVWLKHHTGDKDPLTQWAHAEPKNVALMLPAVSLRSHFECNQSVFFHYILWGQYRHILYVTHPILNVHIVGPKCHGHGNFQDDFL